MLADLVRVTGRLVADLELFERFGHPDETAQWFRSWTDNDEADGREFRLFAMEGGGGFVGLWLVREGRPLTEQPVVFVGSEGELAVMAPDLGSYLWLLAYGVHPFVALGEEPCPTGTSPEVVAVAERHAPRARRGPEEILELAREEFPRFREHVDAQDANRR